MDTRIISDSVAVLVNRIAPVIAMRGVWLDMFVACRETIASNSTTIADSVTILVKWIGLIFAMLGVWVGTVVAVMRVVFIVSSSKAAQFLTNVLGLALEPIVQLSTAAQHTTFRLKLVHSDRW